MADEAKKPTEIGDAALKQATKPNKVTDTAAEKDQAQRFKAIRKDLLKTELEFSFSNLPGSKGSKFELTDGHQQVVAAATRKTTSADHHPATADNHPATKTTDNHPATADNHSAPVADLHQADKTKPVDMNEMQRDAEAIRKATGNDNSIARWADRDGINKILEGKTEAERTAIDQIYKQKYGKGLEEEMKGFEKGSDLDKFKNVLHRSDSNAENQAARHIHEDLLENKNLVQGRSSSEIAKDVRDLVSTRNSDQIVKLDEEYKKTYGTSLKDAISSDSKLPQSTKDMVSIYLKGNDKRTDGDTAQLISIALKEKQSDLFAESMRDASPAARKTFLDNGGEQKVNDAFGHWYSNKDVQQAMDYAKEGKLSAATQVKDNTGVVFDNSKGVELAINRMTDPERKMYLDGKELTQGKTVADLPAADQKKARDYYKELHGALTKTANDAQMTKYENMIAKKPEEAKSVIQEVAASHHWYGVDSEGVLNSISSMSKEDQQKYCSDEKFRSQLDQSVSSSIKDEQQLDAAHRMLKQVKDGKAPDSDVIANLEKLQNYDGSKTGDAVHAVEKSFRDDPALRERVVNPKTDEDRKFAELFKKTAQSTFGDDYDNFGKSLVEKGHLPLEVKMKMNEGIFSNDYKQAFEDLQQSSPEEKQRLKSDPEYQKKVLGFMDENRRQIAMATLDQKELKPQDNIRAAVVGWGGSSDVVDELKKIKPDELAQAKSDYAKKYGSSLEGDLMKKLGGQDRDAAERILAQNLNVEEQANIARHQTEDARSGVGATLSDKVWRSGTGAQADDAQNQTDKALSEKSKTEAAIASGNEIAKNMTPEQIQAVQKRLTEKVQESIKFENQSTDNHVEAKKEAAEYVSDAAITAAAVASLIASGGMDAPLVIGLAATGATLKVGTNALLQGNNYDLSLSQVATDATIGSITGATAAIGPGEIAAVFGAGKTAATEAAALAVTQAGEHTLVEGGKQALENGTKDIVQNALASGAKKLAPAEFDALANKVVSAELSGAEREQAVKQLSENLQKNVSERLATGIVRDATQHSLNAGGGALAGAAGGATKGATEWDSRESVSQNLTKVVTDAGAGALAGAIAGGAISAGTNGLKKILEAVKDGVSSGGVNAATDAAAATKHLSTGADGAGADGGADAGHAAAGGTREAADAAAKKAADQAGSETATIKVQMITTDNYHWHNPDAPKGAQEQIAKKGDYLVYPPDGGKPTVVSAHDFRATLEETHVMSDTGNKQVKILNSDDGSYKVFSHGRLSEERRVTVDQAGVKKTEDFNYPYRDLEAVSKLPTPAEYDEALEKNPALRAAKTDALSRPSTWDDPSINTPDRAALRDRIVEQRWQQLLDTHPLKEKKATILIGLTGSGKSSVGVEKGSMELESDEIKKMLPGYDNGKGATSLMKESNIMNDTLLEKAIKDGYNITVPGVGLNKAWTEQLIKQLHDAGWQTNIVFVDIPPTESMSRVISRFNKDGRFVDPQFLVTHGDQPAHNFHDIVNDLFVNGDSLNGYKHIWNFESEPITIEQGSVDRS